MQLFSHLLVKPNQSLSALDHTIPFDGAPLYLPYFVDLRSVGLPYAVSKFLITNKVYTSYLKLVSKKNLLYQEDPRFNQENHPAVGINFRDAEDYCDWLTARFGMKFTLPTAQIWEEIARCKTDADFSTPTGNCSEKLANIGLYFGGTTPVNQFSPNSFGLHDMTGNALEWTSTVPSEKEMRPEYGAMPSKSEQDLKKNRILKGGCWAFDADNSRISQSIIMGIFSFYYTTGFRPIIDLRETNA